MPSNLKTLQWSQDWKRSVFIPITKKGNDKEYSNYHTIALISHASKIMLKILQARLQQYVNWELLDVQAGFKTAKEPAIKLPTSNVSWRKQKNSGKISTSASLTLLKPLKLWITTNCGKFLETEIPGELTCFLRNLYANQETTFKTNMKQKIGTKWERSISRLYIVTFLT